MQGKMASIPLIIIFLLVILSVLDISDFARAQRLDYVSFSSPDNEFSSPDNEFSSPDNEFSSPDNEFSSPGATELYVGNGVMMRYPADFLQYGRGESWIASFTARDGSITVFINTEPTSSSLFSIVENQIRNYRNSLDDFQEEDRVPVTWAGENDALMVFFTYTSSYQTWRGIDLWTIANGKMYNLTILGLDEAVIAESSELGDMIDSFQIISPSLN